MQQLLKNKQIVKTVISKEDVIIENYLGGGGQGEVYKAEFKGTKKAVKWYYPSSATTEQREHLKILIKQGPPNDRFLWPLDLVYADGIAGYGYIMDLRDISYKSIVDLMKGKIDPSFFNLVTACYSLADSFKQLHSKGYSYRDISFGNVFFNPKNGDILICDNDNVGYDDNNSCGVLGTPSFMAPEIVRGEAKPSVATDLYSLAILLFYMLMISHPLDGKREASIRCMDLPARNKLYGTEPIFIFDPKDDSNRPVKGFHDNALVYWELYPKSLKNLFTKAFTLGIHDPQNGRVRESEWRNEFIKLRDSIIYCPKCRCENFYDQEILSSSIKPVCWQCKSTLVFPPKIKFKTNVCMLNENTKIYPHHIGFDYDFSYVVAEVNRHPQNPNLWGLKNISKNKWILTKPDGNKSEVESGKNVSLVVGNIIDFGQAEGIIQN